MKVSIYSKSILLDGGVSNPVNPADATTYYVGFSSAALNTIDGGRRLIAPIPGIIERIDIYTRVGGTLGSNESVTYSLRRNATTDTALGTTTWDTANKTDSYTGLSIATAVGDFWEIKILTPTWGTNPTNVLMGISIYYA